MSSYRMVSRVSPLPPASPTGLKNGLFWRTFFLLALLLIGSIIAWLQTFRALEYEPRAIQTAQQIASLVNFSRAALRHADPIARVSLIKALDDEEGVQIRPREPGDQPAPFNPGQMDSIIASRLVNHLGPGTVLAADARDVIEAHPLRDTAGATSPDDRVVVVRAFPIAAPTEAVSILSAEGRELVWIDRLDALNTLQRAAIEEALIGREFMPEIQRLDRVSSFATPSVWSVQTDRGPTDFVLKGEEDIRRLSATTLIVADAHGVQFLIRDLPAMDRHTRKLLDRFM